MMAFWESARILGLHCCGAWTACIAFHIICEQMEALGLRNYNFQKTQRAYQAVGWISPLVHMQVCIALKSAVSPKAASMTFVGFDMVTAAVVALAFALTLLYPFAKASLHFFRTSSSASSSTTSTTSSSIPLSTPQPKTQEGDLPMALRGGGVGGGLPGLVYGAGWARGGVVGESRWGRALALLPYALAHGWKVFFFWRGGARWRCCRMCWRRAAACPTTKRTAFTTTKLNLQLPFNLHGTFHWRTIHFSPSRSYLLGNYY